jgi:membrane protein YdbS with pleckstrin-like domain
MFVEEQLMDDVKKLPSEIKSIWRLDAGINFISLLIVALIVWLIRLATSGSFKTVLTTTISIILGAALVILLIQLALIPYRWNFWTYYIDERQVQLHHGYFFRKQIIIPIARIQNVTLKQGPILHWKNLQKVIIVTAAGSSEISGIKSSEADDLKELIMKLAREARNDL